MSEAVEEKAALDERINKVKKSLRARGLTMTSISAQLGCSRCALYTIFRGGSPNSTFRNTLITLLNDSELEILGWKEKKTRLHHLLDHSRDRLRRYDQLEIRITRLEEKRKLRKL